MKKTALIFLLLVSMMTNTFRANAQLTRQKLDSLYRDIELLLGASWYFEETLTGFQVTYCRSCGEAYNRHIDTTAMFGSRIQRACFFETALIDSISYYTNIGSPPVGFSDRKKQIDGSSLKYKANDILRFNVHIEEKWSPEKTDSVLARNNQLKDSILRQPLFRASNRMFDDYRYWLPEDYWRSRTLGLIFYFERLPYKSLIFEESVFILHNKPFDFALPMYVDKNDPEFYLRKQNDLEDERNRVLKTIALVLGIHDYVIVD